MHVVTRSAHSSLAGAEVPPVLQRPARSQISTAVSFEAPRPANSAVVAARSGEDSALSAAELEGAQLLHTFCSCEKQSHGHTDSCMP